MKKSVLILAALTVALTGFVSCKKKDASAAGNSVRTIQVAHTTYYVPYDYLNERGEADGFEVSVLKAVDELLPQYEFKYNGVSDDELLIGIETGKYQVGTKGAWITEERKKKFVIPSEPVGASVIGLVFRTADADKIHDMQSFADYSGKLVPIAPQNAQYNVVLEYNQANPNHQVQLLPSEAFEIADAYTWVLEGRYDGYFCIKLSYQSNVVEDDAPYHSLADKLSYVPYKGIPTWPLFNIKERELADAYDSAVKTLKASGKIAELSQKYFGEDVFQFVTD